jgi:hypothetical protein
MKFAGISDSSFVSKALTDLYFMVTAPFAIPKGKVRAKFMQ